MKAEKHNKIKALKGTSLFSKLPDAALIDIASKSKIRQFFPNETIVWQGKPSDSLFIIINGIVVVKKVISSDKEQIFAYLMPGNTFGEVGILENQPRSATVAALSDVDVLVIRRNDFLDMLHSYPNIAIELAKMLGKYLIESNRRQSRGNRNAKVILIFNVASDAGGTTIGNALCRVVFGKSELPTVYAEYPTPQQIMAELNIKHRGNIYKHDTGYDILLSPEDSAMPAAARTTLLLDNLLNDYNYIVINLQGNSQIDENIAMMLDYVNQILIITPPIDEYWERVEQLQRQIKRHVRIDEVTVFTIVNKAKPEYEKIVFEKNPDFEIPYLTNLCLLPASSETSQETVIEDVPVALGQALSTIVDRLERVNQIGIYIPTTIATNQEMDTSDYVQAALNFLAERFGGATSKEAKGVWNSEEVGLVDEKVYLVYTYATRSDMNKYLDEVVEYVKEIKTQLSQEAMALEVNNKLTLI
jgi:CRP-like cAMP-binding protein